jgi:hypothetical protein
LKRLQRQRWYLAVAVSIGQFLQSRLKTFAGGLKLAGQLGVEVAAFIDLSNERIAFFNGPVGCGARPRSTCAERSELPSAFFERHARLGQTFETFLIGGDAILIDARQRRHDPRAVRYVTDVGYGQHHAQIASAAQLVQLDEPVLNLRPFAGFLRLDFADLHVEGGQVGGCGAGLRIDLAKFLLSDLPFELQLPKIAEKRPRFGRKIFRLPMQSFEPLGGAAGERLRSGALRILSR